MSPAVSSVPESKTNVAASNGKVMVEDRYEPSYYRHVIRSLSAYLRSRPPAELPYLLEAPPNGSPTLPPRQYQAALGLSIHPGKAGGLFPWKTCGFAKRLQPQ